MKKSIYILFAVILSLFAFSCAVENPVQPQLEVETLEFIADFNDAEAKTTLAQGQKVLWTQTDRISVFNGQQSAPFQVSKLTPDQRSAHFTGTLPQAECYWALYPQQGQLQWAHDVVAATLPTVQQAVAGSFAEGAALAVAQVENQELHFKNVGALLAVTINNDNIRCVRITSADGTALTGAAEITIAATPSVKAGADAQSYVELQGNFVKGKTYYAVVYPGNQANGFELTFTDNLYRTASFKNQEPIDIQRNAVINLVKNLVIPASKWTGPGEDIPGVENISISDFLNAPVNKKKWYKMTGIVRNITSTTYGNFDLVDESGSVYVYGLTKTKTNGKNDKSFSQIGVKEGDLLTLVGTRSDFNGKAEVAGPAYHICHSTPAPAPSPNPEPDSGPNPGPDPNPDPTPQPDPTPGDGTPANGQTDWLEMPGTQLVGGSGMYCVTHHAKMNGKNQRNYSLLYDSNMLTSYWVAYPLCKGHMGKGRNEKWAFDPKIPQDKQTSVKSGYKLSISTPNYSTNSYARGHQIPNADRSGVTDMVAQTYYSTNMTPQIQNGFNGGIWVKLEEGARAAVNSDTLYMVTGAAFNKVGENLPVKKVKNGNDGKMMPVPNFYWKVMLKVKRGGPGNITSATTAAFWLPHQDLKGHEYIEYETTVDQIEAWTGFDFFVNVPENLQKTAEAQKDCAAFSKF